MRQCPSNQSYLMHMCKCALSRSVVKPFIISLTPFSVSPLPLATSIETTQAYHLKFIEISDVCNFLHQLFVNAQEFSVTISVKLFG
jgi:hypothetical protein